MNRSKIALAFLVLFAGLPLTAKAQLVSLYQNSYSYSNGGEFTAYTTPNNFLNFYAPAATVNGGFETFCIESSVEFIPGTTYSYVLTSQESTGQHLSMGAAYLYNKFATGSLAGYDYTDAATRKADNAELQSAFWALQGQTIVGGFPSIGSDPYYNMVLNDLGGSSAAFADSNGAYGVDILQLYDKSGAPAQAQLVVVTPEPSTLLLFVFAAALVVLLGRRKFGLIG